jgi:outer membrane immunogenic protein
MRKSVLGSASAIAMAVAMGGTAWAADMPVKAAPAPAAQLFNWSGWYAGVDVGEDWLKLWSDSQTTLYKSHKGFYGGHLGFNVQSGQWVWGLEGDLGGTSNTIHASDNTYKVNLLTSLRGRLGIAFDRVLFYGTAGIGFVNGPTHESTGQNGHVHHWRPVVGAGIEYALTNQWLLRGQVLDYAGHKNIGPGDDPFESLKSVWVATIGLSYKFDSWGGKGPVVARY